MSKCVRNTKMSKAIIYDTDKQEYVTAVNRRLVSGTIDYLTSENEEDAQVVDSDELNLRNIEKAISLKRGTLVFKDVPKNTVRANKRRKAINSILNEIESYSNRFERQDEANELLTAMLSKLEWIYGFDTDDWQNDLEEMLNDAYDY